MESIYYVLCWACHRRCSHCYETRFRPYVRDELEGVVAEAEASFPHVIDHFPERMVYRDFLAPADGSGDGAPERIGRERIGRERIGRIILSGGEVLVNPVRERVLYPALERLRRRYGEEVRLVVQTTGDLVTPEIVDDLLARGVWMISVAGMDDFHVGMEGEKRVPLKERLTGMLEDAGMRPSGLQAATREWHEEEGPLYSFFGATEDAWIGKIWPRGRAWENGLSRAGMSDNFCNAWSGGLGFLNHGLAGSEVSVEPNGNAYPCCLKTKVPIGNLVEERLTDILDSLAGHPAFEAIASGHPERMGIAYGWDVATFLAKSHTTTRSGRPYGNLCIGCDRFHVEVLRPVIEELRQSRLSARARAVNE